MDDKEFCECKNEIIAALDKHKAQFLEIPRVISAAMNEKIASRGWQSIIEFVELPDIRVTSDKN